MKVGFLGSGNMARSLGHRLKNSAPNIQQYFYSPTGTKARQLSVEVNGTYVPLSHKCLKKQNYQPIFQLIQF
jgi:3-hydroxyisobutyrate dehydrogenase-like beta-hydroxyacid dehydrogenase